ncbi:hypothetical protein [Bacillus altitudinis]|uniref:hypothetical protein n=1 Tax=Bacillus altitudinis TaxID=293387 RepID=UPI0038B64E55
MKKWFIVLSVSLIFVLMLSSIPASAAGPRHGAIVTQTDEAKWSGITADIVLPKTATIKNGYADWYLGLGSAVVESGISKTASGYKVFLGTGSQGGSQYWNSEYDSSIKDGARVNLKLINNGDGTVSLYVNGKLRYKQPVYNPSRLKNLDVVKMVHGVQDNGTNSYSQASFSNVQLRANTSGSVYKKWDGTVKSSLLRKNLESGASTPKFTVISSVPLSTTLSAQ